MPEIDFDLTGARKYLMEQIIPVTGAILRRNFEENLRAREEGRVSKINVKVKNPKSYETTNDVDISLDALVQERLRHAFPNIPYLSEDSADSTIRNMSPDEKRKIPLLWDVDIVDGSGRFVNFSKKFSSSFALLRFGRTVLAVVHKPMGNHIWWAQEDEEGAYKDGQRIFVSETQFLRDSMLSTAYAWNLGDRENTTRLLHERISQRANQPGLNAASSVLDMLEVAEGKIAGHVSEGLTPWDLGGAPFIVVKAGGESTNNAGELGNPFMSDVVITNGKIHKELLDVIQEELSEMTRMKNPRSSLRDILLMPVHVVGEKIQPLVEATRPVRQVAGIALAVPTLLLNILAHGFAKKS